MTPARITFDSARFGNGSLTVDEVPTRIAPPPRARIDGTTRRTVRITLSSSSSNAFCHAMSSKLSAVPAGGPPVLANSRSTPPNRSVVAAIHRVIASALLKSAATASARPPLAGVDRRRRPLDAVLVARRDRDVRAFRRQRARHGEAEPLARAADHRHFVRETQIHGPIWYQPGGFKPRVAAPDRIGGTALARRPPRQRQSGEATAALDRARQDSGTLLATHA